MNEVHTQFTRFSIQKWLSHVECCSHYVRTLKCQFFNEGIVDFWIFHTNRTLSKGSDPDLTIITIRNIGNIVVINVFFKRTKVHLVKDIFFHKSHPFQILFFLLCLSLILIIISRCTNVST